jgi:hypothetical protein
MRMRMRMRMPDEENIDTAWGGSLKGRSSKRTRDFTQAYNTVIGHYFSGIASLYDEVHFEQQFGMPQQVFNTIWENIQGKGSFKQHTKAVSRELSIYNHWCILLLYSEL